MLSVTKFSQRGSRDHLRVQSILPAVQASVTLAASTFDAAFGQAMALSIPRCVFSPRCRKSAEVTLQRHIGSSIERSQRAVAMDDRSSRTERTDISKLPCVLACLCGFGWAVICLAFTSASFMRDEPVSKLILGTVWCLFLGGMAVSALVLVRSPKAKSGHEFVWACVNLDKLGEATPQFNVVRLEPGACKPCLERKASPAWTKPYPQKTCLCCLEDFQSQDTMALLPCGHVYHESCLVDWFSTRKTQGTCPLCRYSTIV